MNEVEKVKEVKKKELKQETKEKMSKEELENTKRWAKATKISEHDDKKKVQESHTLSSDYLHASVLSLDQEKADEANPNKPPTAEQVETDREEQAEQLDQ